MVHCAAVQCSAVQWLAPDQCAELWWAPTRCTGVTCSGVLQCSLLPFSASQARTGVFSAVTGHRPPRHGVDGGRRAWTLPWPRPAAPAEPIRIGVTPGTPILSRRRPRHGPSAVRPAFGGGAQDLPASAQNLRRLCTGFPSHSPCGDASPRSWSGSPPTSGEPPGRRPPPPSISLD